MTRKSLPLLIAVCTFISRPALAQRLPTGVTPEHYDLTFTLDLAAARFSGRTGIDVRLAQMTSEIRLNALELDITSASISAGGQTQTARVTLDTDAQTATLTTTRPIPAGRARIEIDYRASLNQQLRGLYESKGPKRSYAVTQFESTDARRAFPCFDEPAFKSTFAVTVVASRGDVAIANGRMISDTPGPRPDQHTMKFSTTAKISSYLVALAIGDFECLSGASDGVPIRICATPDKKALGKIALESAEQILAYLNRYHTIKYPFEKLDVVAVPDFAAGAMENVAAIFYRETDLLAESASASLNTRKTIVSILSHEMAHMWFGDLVTMQWWDDLWLNEGFATWMASRPAAAMKAEWRMDVSEALENQTALGLDSLKSTHPIHVNVNTPSEIESVFDPISYEKGASVLRMVEAYVGEENFRKGVNDYLEKHKYANATSEDFFAALTAASGKPVDRVMGTFVLQAGVPQLDVTAGCSNNRATVTIKQSRFLLDGSTSQGRERWQIPVCLKAPGSASPSCVVMTETTQTFPLGETCGPWVFANAGGRGYYRTVYSGDSLKAIARDVQSSLTPAERLSLVSDEWALVRAGRHTVDNYLDLASGFGRESIPQVLDVVAARLGFIDTYLTTDANRKTFQAFVRTLFEPAYKDIGFDRAPGDSEDRRSLRNAIVGALGETAEDPEIVDKATRAVRAALGGGPALDPILAGTLVNIAATHGDTELFDLLSRAAAKAKSPDEHYRYLFALTSFENPSLLARALEHARSNDLKSQDTAIFLGAFFGNDATRGPAWSFVKANWSELLPKVNVAGSDINLISSLSSFCSAEARDDIRTFFASHPLPTASRALQQTLERIDNCVATRRVQQAALGRWLEAR
jgi:aminopeptidase N